MLLKFAPILKTLLWGGDKIIAYKGLDTDARCVGESWELSGVEGCESVVAGGPCDGIVLSELIARLGARLVGRSLYERFGVRFPLLVKFIDARRDLSIQVHPDDELARARHSANGKSEMWYVIGADPGARLYSGFARPVTPAEYEAGVADHTLAELLQEHTIAEGDVFYLPAGCVHSIGAGSFVAEIQQTSDLTYRIYDYGRLGSDGKPRILHTELAREAIDFTYVPDRRTLYTPARECRVPLLSTPHFTAELCDLTRPFACDLASLDSFVVLVCVAGQGTVTDDTGESQPLHRGETLLVSASVSGLAVAPAAGGMKFLMTYIG